MILRQVTAWFQTVTDTAHYELSPEAGLTEAAGLRAYHYFH